MQKYANKLTIAFILILLLIIIIVPLVKSQQLVSIQGYVYLDGEKIKPSSVSLIPPTDSPIFILSDGMYDFMDEIEGTYTATFQVTYQNVQYTPIEDITFEEGEDYYYLDLHIVTGSQPPDDDDEEPTNIQPVADAGGPYHQIINQTVYFDGSVSDDPDGTITKYEWDFGDDETGSGIKPTHTYLQAGKYQVKLTVTDNEDATDISYAYAYITETENIQPSNLTISGPTNGTIQTEYDYSIQAIDENNDSLQYIIDWDDGTQTNSTFLQNGTIFTTNHSYNEPGIYNITAIAVDENNLNSETVKLTVLIDTTYCENIGYMVDYTGDGVYDLFHANTTGIETPVEKNNDNYLIDINNNGSYDYEYNPATHELFEYTGQDASGQITPETSFTLPLRTEIILAIAFVIVVIVLISYMVIRRKRPRKKKKKQKPKKKEKKKIKIREESKDIKDIEKKIKEIEDRIDEILSKKK